MNAGHRAIWGTVLSLAIVGLPFVPLLLSVAEEAALGTHYVEGACRALGVHGMFRRFYEAFGIF